MSILKAFKSTIRKMCASPKDYNDVCMEVFDLTSGNDRIDLKKSIDRTLDEASLNNDSPLERSKNLHFTVSKFVLETENYEALSIIADKGLDNERLLRMSIDKKDLNASAIFLEAGANPDTDFERRSSAGLFGSSYQDFNCLSKANSERYFAVKDNSLDRIENADKMVLLLLDHGASITNKITKLSSQSRARGLSGEDIFDLSMSFSLDEYKQAKKLSNGNLTTMDHIKEVQLDNDLAAESTTSNLKAILKQALSLKLIYP